MKLYQVSENLSEPISIAHEWIKEAEMADSPLPHAMNIATINLDGSPSSRMVLLKKITDRGFIFFTDYEGNKGKQISLFSQAAITFWWAKTNKQIRIEGHCSKISDEENDEYFYSRPRGSQISASVSRQSSSIDSYENLVNDSKIFEKNNAGKKISRPDRWGGYILKPILIEFWEDQSNRLHKRKLFKFNEGNWEISYLSP